ncbi:hypothetical protein I316_00784 [Kwoniella heveanensis BCC8398]|uniref:Uncharacterized protein n=1 Tax=Kwoniella heveanensis BCC8398 TaxID=1296120 RepID=A0A1B9H327_9TREE|nr:hypothetical protein I316_00784 [Kwoniella heveanensis BCC8398]
MLITKHLLALVALSLSASVLSAPIDPDCVPNDNDNAARSLALMARQDPSGSPGIASPLTNTALSNDKSAQESDDNIAGDQPSALTTPSSSAVSSPPSGSARMSASASGTSSSSAAKPSSSSESKDKDGIHFKNDFPDSFKIGDKLDLEWEGGDGHYQLYAIVQYPGLSNIRPINLERNTTSTSHSYTIDLDGEQYHDSSKLTIGIASTSDDRYGFERVTKPLTQG